MGQQLIYLFLDDEETRFNLMEQHYPNARIIWVKNLDEFVAEAPKRQWTRIFLDHDLGLNMDTMQLREWLHNNRLQVSGGFIVHSMNSVGGANIVAMLEGYGYTAKQVPFYKLME